LKSQGSLILAILFALLVALFAVINVDPVKVDYFFGTAKWPLILIILGSVLAGVIIMGAVGARKIYALKREMKVLRKEKDELEVRNHLANTEAEPHEKNNYRLAEEK
jgi:uncharacterized integral membrane protein